MKTSLGKTLFLMALLILVASPAITHELVSPQQTAPTNATPLEVDLTVPSGYTVMFIAPAGGRGVVFFKSPDGTAAVIPTT